MRVHRPVVFVAAATAALLATGTAFSGSASATGEVADQVTMSAALYALPSAEELLPLGALRARGSTQAGAGALEPCGDGSRVTLGGVGAQANDYRTPVGPQFDPAGSGWVVGVRVYQTVADAQIDRERIVAAERQCATVRHEQIDGAAVTIRRAAGRPVDAGGWSGYRSVDVWSNAPKQNPLRSIATFLQRGNVIVEVIEVTATSMPASRASRWFRQAVRLVATRLTAESTVPAGL